ncbi:MAG: polysaccharide biosynthesis protein [Clostridiales bacterium]|nr:polysaccharide biosynthesis protein [Clostridiales bacterium]
MRNNKQMEKNEVNGRLVSTGSISDRSIASSVLLAVYDVIAVILSFFVALLTRFDFSFDSIPDEFLKVYFRYILFYAAFCFAVFLLLKLYRSIWKYASMIEMARILAATLITCVVHVIAVSLFVYRMPVSYYLVGSILQFFLVAGVRFAYRLVLLIRGLIGSGGKAGRTADVMVVGAGGAGQLVLRDMRNSKEFKDRVACVIDDDPSKKNHYIEGVQVVGNRYDIPAAVERFHIKKIFVAMPSVGPADLKGILDICKDTGCEIRNLPGVYQFFNEFGAVSSMKEISAEDLLGRESVRFDMSGVYPYIAGSTVLVTGGAGLLGSELCRQIARYDPKRLIALDLSENDLFELREELTRRDPGLVFTATVGSVADPGLMKHLFGKYRPDIVIHAACRKAIPLMEDNVLEAVGTNVFGTLNAAVCAGFYGAEKFVFVSSFKAVYPTGIAGACTRAGELIVRALDEKVRTGITPGELREYLPGLPVAESGSPCRTKYTSVRFGNVLGTRGTAVSLFKKQIESGGPVYVMHPDMIRNYLLPDETASMILRSVAIGEGGDVLIFDRGTGVNIDEFARNLIRLSGLRPDVDIKVEYIGLRPGEKLKEDTHMAEEEVEDTGHLMISAVRDRAPCAELLTGTLESLRKACGAGDSGACAGYLKSIVPTYRPAGRAGEEIG